MLLQQLRYREGMETLERGKEMKISPKYTQWISYPAVQTTQLCQGVVNNMTV